MAGSLVFYAGSVALGAALGAVFVRLWRTLVPPGTTRKMMSELVLTAVSMARAEEARQFLDLYKLLFSQVGRYLVRNLGGLALACLPMLVVLTVVAPPTLDAWDRRAESMAFYPRSVEPAVLEAWRHRLQDNAPHQSSDRAGETAHARIAICESTPYCALFALLAYDIHEATDGQAIEGGFLILRPEHGNANFLWPYLGDLEFAFFCAFLLAGLAAFLLPRRAQ